jgi:hypothetical protein
MLLWVSNGIDRDRREDGSSASGSDQSHPSWHQYPGTAQA